MDELQKLYDVLVREGYFTKSFDEFKNKWQDESYKSKVYNVVSRDGLYTKDEQSFYDKYSLSAIEQPKTKSVIQPETSKKKEGGFGQLFSQPLEQIKEAEELVSQSDQSSSVSPQNKGGFPVTPLTDEYGIPLKDLQQMGSVTQSSTVIEKPVNKIEADKKALIYEKKIKKEAAENLLNWRETESRKIQEEEKAKEEEARLRNEALGISKTPDFVNKLNKIDNSLFYNNELIDNLNDEFSQYGIVITKGGIFNNKLIARTEDGRKAIDIDLTPNSEADMVSESEKLRNFISENNRVTKEEDFLSAALRARNMRSSARINDDGSTSTVKFVSFDNKVIPTLFPLVPGLNSTSKDAWIELPFEQALKVAKERGEVFTFKTDKEAQDFANGAWKDVSKVDIEGDKFYKDRGRDYITEKRRWERYDELDDMIDFFEGYDTENKEQMMKEYPEMFVNGKPRYDIKEVVSEMKKERDLLRPLVKDISFLNQEGTSEWTRMDFDVHLAKKQQETAKEATKIFRNAQTDLSIVNAESLKAFGVTIDQLAKKDKSQIADPATYESLMQKYMDATQLAKTAGAKYDEAKTYFDAKTNKEINNEFVENAQAAWNGFNDGLNNGLIGDQLAAFLLPDYNPYSKFKDKKNASDYISDKLSKLSNTQSRVMTRFAQTRGMIDRDWWDAFLDDPFEAMAVGAASSISLMLPIGSQIIPLTTVTGGLTGAAIGAATTAPAGGSGVLPGYLGGLSKGFATGQAITGYMTEWTTAIMDAVKNNGYDPLDPRSLETALNDQKVWDEGRNVGAARGIPIAVVDFLTGSMAGRIFKPASKLASVSEKIAKGTVENVVIDPTAEAAGEYIAQQSEMFFDTGRNALDWNEIALEGVGSMGTNLPNYVLNTYQDTKKNTDIDLAYNLTDIKKLASERVSDERISNWANNMEKLGKIDASVNQRIQENIGLRRDAKEVLSVGSKGAGSNTAVTSRTMELLAAKKELTATNNRQEVYSAEIKAINEELSTIGKTKKIPDKEQQVNLNEILDIPEAQREGVGEYMIDGRRYTKDQFLDKIKTFTPERFGRSKIAVKNDNKTAQLFKELYDKVKEETNQQQNAIQEQTTDEGVLRTEQPQMGLQEMGEGEPQAGPEGTTQEGVLSPEENKRKEELRTALAEAPSGATTITIGETTMDKAEAQTELNSIFEKEQAAPKAQPAKQSTVDIFTSAPTETKAEITFMSPEGNEVTLQGNEQVAAQMYDEAVAVPVEQRTQEQNDIVQKLEPIVAENEANILESLLSPEVTPEAAPVEQFTEQDKARQQELTDALAKSDKRRKNVMVGEMSIPKAEVKAELDALNQKEQGAQQPATGEPKFQKGEQLKPVEDIEAVTEEMNSMPEDVANFDVPSDLSTDKKINIKSLIKRFGNKLKAAFKGGIIKDISEYNGIPMIFTISDQLSSGKIKNEFTGNTIDLNGGIAFNLTEGNENNAWANTDKKEAESMLARAKEVYNKNKDLFDRLWAEGKLPYGQIPMAVVKMGQDSIQTNEALFRFASDTIKSKFSETERKNSLNGLIDDIVSFAIDSENRRRQKKGVALMTQEEIDAMSKDVLANDKVINFIKDNDYKTIDQLLDNLNKLKPIGERANVTKFLFTGGIALNKETKPGKPRSKSALALVGDKDSSYYKYIHLQTINNIIQEDATKEIPPSHIIAITGVDVLNSEITSPNHRNYPYGVKGGLIGILESPVHAADVFPEMYSKTFYLQKENISGEATSPKAAVEQSVAASGPVASIKAFRGSKMSTKMTELQKLLGKLKLAFPSVTIVETQQEFEKALDDPEVKKFVKDGEVVYGFTKDGKIFLNPEKANKNTAIHEFAHIWMNFLKENNPKLLEKGYALLEGTEVLKRKIEEFGNTELAREEALAELIANKGETLIEAGKKSKFKNWLNALYTYVKSKFKSFNKLSPEEFQNISLNDFVDGALASLLSGKEITSKEIKSIGVLFSKEKPKNTSDIIKTARANGISDAGIRAYFKKNGFSDTVIDSLLEKEKGTAKEIKLSEDTLPGYTKLMNRIEGVIKRSMNRGVKFNDIMENVINNVQNNSPEYANATDQQKEQIIRDIRALFGKKEKAAPSAKKITGSPAPKKVVVDDYKQLKREINLVNKSIKEGRKTVRDAVKEMVRLFKKSKVITKLTRSDLNKIIGLMDKVYDEASLQKAVGQMFDIILKSNEDIVEISNKKRLAQLSKAFYKGVRETKKDLKAKRAMLTEQIKKMSAEGVISLAKANIIIDKINKVNLDNPDMVQRLLDYIGKVFDDAEYDSKLTNANKLRSQIKQLSKNKTKFGNLTDFARKFAQIDPSMVSDIDQYIAMALDVKEGVSGSKFTPDGVKPAAMLDINEANKYLEKTLEEQAETIKKRTADKIENLIGVDVSDLTYEKMLQLIDLIKREELEKDKEKKRELSDEINDAFGTNKDKETAIKSLLSKMFDTYSSIIESMFRTGIDPFADTTLPSENLEFKKSDIKLVREFMNMDLNLLSRTEALKAIDALNNFIVNKSTANMANVLASYNGKKNAETALKKGLKALTLRLYFNATIGRTYAEQFASVPLFFEKLFKGATKGAEMQELMGITSLVNHKAEAEALANRITMEYINEFNKKNPNGKKFLSLYNIIERGIIADLSKTINGTESQISDEFFRRKQLIQETIEILNKSGSKQEIQQAKVIKEVFDKIAKDAKTIEDVKKKADQINIDAVQFWINKWEGLYDEFADVALNVYNRVLDKSINYTPDRFSFLERAVDIKGLVDTGQSTFFANSNYFYKKEAGSLMKATPPSTLKKDGKANMYVNLSFDTNNVSALMDALIDIKTAADIRQIQAFTETQQFEELLPNAKDAAALKRRIDILVRNIRNKGQYVDPSFKEMIKNLDRIATWGAGLALGGFSQIPKQTLSVGVNTLINAGKLNISAIRNKDVNNFINNSGMAIANRGFDAVTELQSLDQKIEQAVDYPPAKFAKFLEDVNKAYLKIFLVNFDSMIARASWISYYEKSLKKQGISTKGIDYSTHQINQKAANYAQMMVDRQQNISDKDLAGAFFTTNNPARQFIVKTAFPFASFRMNQTMRTMNDLTVLSSKSASREDKIIAGKSLVGFAAEMATFKAVSLGLSWTWYLLAQAIRGKEEDEEKRKKRWSNMVKGQATSAVSDVFSPIPVFDAPVKYIFNSMLDQMQNIINIDEEDRYSIFTEEKVNLAKSYGMYGIALDKFTKLAEVYQLAGTGRHIDSFGNEKYISPEDQNLIMASAVILTFVDLGLLPAPEITGVINNIIKTSTSEAKTKKQLEQQQTVKPSKPFLGMPEKEFKEKYPNEWRENYGPGTEYYQNKIIMERENKDLEKEMENEIKEMKREMDMIQREMDRESKYQ